MSPIRYSNPRRVWVVDDEVYAETHDGRTVVMSAEVAIHVSRLFGTAGGDALMHRVRRRETEDADDGHGQRPGPAG